MTIKTTATLNITTDFIFLVRCSDNRLVADRYRTPPRPFVAPEVTSRLTSLLGHFVRIFGLDWSIRLQIRFPQRVHPFPV